MKDFKNKLYKKKQHKRGPRAQAYNIKANQLMSGSFGQDYFMRK